MYIKERERERDRGKPAEEQEECSNWREFLTCLCVEFELCPYAWFSQRSVATVSHATRPNAAGWLYHSAD